MRTHTGIICPFSLSELLSELNLAEVLGPFNIADANSIYGAIVKESKHNIHGKTFLFKEALTVRT